MFDRPYKTPKQMKDSPFFNNAIELLEKHYFNYINSQELGLVDTSKLDKEVFDKVKADLPEMKQEEQETLEAIFDTFAGAMLFFQDSAIVFKQLKSM